ncbi:MAG: hypothetical protein QNK80_10000 [Akkermansiaceae bacterium]
MAKDRSSGDFISHNNHRYALASFKVEFREFLEKNLIHDARYVWD